MRLLNSFKFNTILHQYSFIDIFQIELFKIIVMFILYECILILVSYTKRLILSKKYISTTTKKVVDVNNLDCKINTKMV